jgi:hypothetical protein
VPRNTPSHQAPRAIARMYENRDPSSPAAARVIEKMVTFIREHAQ